MASSSAPPDSSGLRSEDYHELQNPREEAPFTQYYEELDPEEPLTLLTFSNGEVYSTAETNSNGLIEYNERHERVDKIRQSRLKIPSFRKIPSHIGDHPGFNPSGVKNDDTTTHLHSTAILEKLGFYNIGSDKNKLLELPLCYLRPDLNRDALIRGKQFYEAKSFQAHYDMDETDLGFLNWINEISKESISMEHFEIIISFFESKIYQLERILPPTIKDRSTIDYQQQQRAFLYGSDDGTGYNKQDDQACAICDSSECDTSNPIIYCDGCNMAVHQDCYGVPFIPEGPWLCRRCLIARNSSEKCLICPSTTGAFKQTDGGDWAHVLCALWTPDLYFANPIYMEPIEGIENIPKSRWNLVCFICKQKVGACIQCSKPSCVSAYHVTCAKRAGLYMKMKKNIKTAINDNSCLISYCDKHTPAEWATHHDIKEGIDKTRLYFHDRKNKIIDESANSEMTLVTDNEYKELNLLQSDKFLWRLDQNVYVIPAIIINELINFNLENKLPTISKLTLNQIAKYYTLKRKFMGKPLIKRPDVFNHASLPGQELEAREMAVQYFTHDIEKLTELTKLIVKKSKLNNSLISNKLETSTIINEPKKWIFCNLVSFFKTHFTLQCSESSVILPKYAVKPTIYQIIHKCESGEYSDLELLINDIEKFSNWLIHISLKSNSSLVELQKLFKSWQRYKKAKYQNAREYYELATHHWDLIRENFEMHDNLEFDVAKQEEHTEEENDNNNGIKMNAEISDTDNKIHTKRKYKKRNKGMVLGIDVSEFLKNNLRDPTVSGRHLRTRKSSTNTGKVVGQSGLDNNGGGVLKARLNRVRMRTNVQNLRSTNSRLRKRK